MRQLFKAGRHKKARKLYRQLLSAILGQGRVPTIDVEVHGLFRGNDGSEAWSALMADCGKAFVKAGRYCSAFEFSSQLCRRGENQEDAQLLDSILAEVPQGLGRTLCCWRSSTCGN